MQTEEPTIHGAGQILADGFAIFSGVFDDPEISAVTGELAQSQLPRGRAGLRHAMREPAVAQLASHPRLLTIAQEVLGPSAFPFRATLFDKSPASNWLVGWHQDTALPLKERRETPGWGPWSVKDGIHYAHAPSSALEQVLALRVHLDDSTSENGPLRVLPATHGLGVLNDQQLHELSTLRNAVECVVPLGGVVTMRPLIVHASSKSKTDRPRRVLHFEYSAAATFGEGLQLQVA
jgi:ectoine hydroxylase-related dioxygenase (phytanoyl-CoA dioxygenase family)